MDGIGLVFVRLLFIVVVTNARFQDQDDLKLLIMTTSSSETDSHQRFMDNAKLYGHEVEVLRQEKSDQCLISNHQCTMNTGKKIKTLKDGLKKHKDTKDLVILLTESKYSILRGNKKEILREFISMNARLVFSGDSTTMTAGDKFKNIYQNNDVHDQALSSGGIIGYAEELWSLFNQWPVTRCYNNEMLQNITMRESLNATLDYREQIFRRLRQEDFLHIKTRSRNRIKVGDDMRLALSNTQLQFSKFVKELQVPLSQLNFQAELKKRSRTKNSIEIQDTMNTSLIILGNEKTKIYLNYLSNYIPVVKHPKTNCSHCDDNELEIDFYEKGELPHVMVAIFMIPQTTFLDDFLALIISLEYDKTQLSLLFHYQDTEAEKAVEKFLDMFGRLYKSVKTIPKDLNDRAARNQALMYCLEIDCDYYYNVDSTTRITNSETLQHLIVKNKQVIAPLMTRHEKLWSNFWGAFDHEGYYARSPDYSKIADRKRIGVWNVPFVHTTFLVKKNTLKNLLSQNSKPFGDENEKGYTELDTKINFCKRLAEQDVFMYVTNEYEFGRLLHINEEDDDIEKVYPELWEVERNGPEFENRYIHPDFWQAIEEDTPVEQPCTDVFKFPLMTETMADQLVETVETADKWSNGGSKDPRISGGYENVPTVDVHMKQFGFEKEWLHFLSTYVSRMVSKVYPGYDTDAESEVMFIVRYRPDEQPSLRPHHDHATWTINIALNNQKTDYEGGGCRFLRYNCSVTNTPKGWALLHPGRLTHYHEGLYTTKGTRYILVSFMDP